MSISAKDVMNLRKRTGLGMMECKKALTETNGDVDGAIALLRKKLKGKMDDRTDRESAEGVVAVASDAAAITLVELTCETDFVGRNDRFAEAAGKIAELALHADDGQITAGDDINRIVDELRITIQENIAFRRGVRLSGGVLGSYVHHNKKIGAVVRGEGDLGDELLKGICQHIAAAVPIPLAVDPQSLDPDELARQKIAAIEEAQASGKPQSIAEKIATGKLRKWTDEHTLMGQIYLREQEAKKPVREFLPEGTKITTFVRYQVGG